MNIFDDKIILENILPLLNPNDISNLMQTSRSFYVYCNYDSLWKDFYLDEYEKSKRKLFNNDENKKNKIIKINNNSSNNNEGDILFSGDVYDFMNRFIFMNNWRLSYIIFKSFFNFISKYDLYNHIINVIYYKNDNVLSFINDNNNNHSLSFNLYNEYKLKFDNFYSDLLYNEWQCSSMNIDPLFDYSIDNIDRIDGDSLSYDDFSKNYGFPNKPVIIKNIASKWKSFDLWDRDYLINNYGNYLFKMGSIQSSLYDFFNYISKSIEERPAYLFDNEFGENYPNLLDYYDVPSYFKNDYFSLLDDYIHEYPRPSYRWILIGAKRSGSTFHKDPNSTSAWNACLRGRKKWIFYPPDKVPPGVFPSDDHFDVTTPTSPLEWYLRFYHPSKESIECIQYPGEIVYVPNGWWHQVINLDETIAVTQNFVNEWNIMNVLKFLKNKKKKKLWNVFSKIIKEKYPDIYKSFEESEDKEKKLNNLWEKDKSFSFLRRS